jgi:Ca2+-binding RTX toxin-like protein
MKGVDTITGQVNGFVNIVPDLGSVAVGFTGEFSTLAGSGTTVASFGSLVEVSNSSENTTLITGAELLATTYNTNLVPTTNLIEWPAEESDSAFEYMDSATFATFDTFVGAKSKSGTYKLDGVVSNIADFAIFTPAYKYGFLDGYSYLSLHWENGTGGVLEVVEQTNEILTPKLISTTTLFLQDNSGSTYGGQANLVDSTDMSATLVFEEINPGDVTSEEVTQVVATDASFKVFEDALSAIDGYSVGDRIVNIAYVPVIDKEKLSIGDIAGAFKMEQVLVTTNDLGIDMVYNDGLVYTVKDQQGVFGSLSLVLPGSYTDSYYSTPFFGGFDNILKGWAYSLDNTDPDTIALSPGETGYDLFTVNVSDGVNTSSMEIQIFVTGSDHKLGGYRDNILQDDVLQGTDFDEYFTPLEGADVINAMSGNDIINLHAYNSIWASGYVAKNVGNIDSIGTGQVISLEGMNRFSDVIDGGDDIDVLNLTDGNDAFFIDDVYSDHHSSLAPSLTSISQGIDSTARIVNLEVINAGSGNDIVDLTSANFILTNAVEINGEAGNDTLWGSNGNDTVNGGEGNDTIFGGTGNDTLTGGIGFDTFQFTATAANDIITDFSLTDDSIQLYYRAEDNHTNTNLSFASGVLTWDVDSISNDIVVIDLSVATTSSNFSDIDQLITFVEIV